MNILLTVGPGHRFEALREALAANHDVQTLELPAHEPEDWTSALNGVDALVHGAFFEFDESGEAIAQACQQTYALGQSLAAASVDRVVMISRLEVFDAFDPRWRIDEMWRPRPRPLSGELGPHAVERCLREFARTGAARGVCLRLRPADLAAGAQDLIAAVDGALNLEFNPVGYRWHICHLSRSDRFETRDARRFLGLDLPQTPEDNPVPSPQPTATPPAWRHPQKVVLIGAGGGVGRYVWDRLRDEFDVVLADRSPLDHVGSYSPGWNREPRPANEQWREVDVTDLAAVKNLVQGADAVVNLTVVRDRVDAAFAVNLGGAYNVCRACAETRVPRLIHTGPWARVNRYEGDYRYEYDLDDNIPYRAGTWLYPHSKFLSAIVARSFAEELGQPTFTFWISRIRPGDALDGRDDDVFIPFSVSWEDLAEAIHCGLVADPSERIYEEFFICAPTPQEKYHPRKAIDLLGWRPRDHFAAFYQRPSFSES